MAAELGAAFQLNQALRLGMLPVVLGEKQPAEILRAYNGLYLREEVQAEGLVRNVGSFARFLEAISFSQCAVLNLANVARECQVNGKTAEGYLEILEDLLLAFQGELNAHPVGSSGIRFFCAPSFAGKNICINAAFKDPFFSALELFQWVLLSSFCLYVMTW
jgi:hypothetical protein